jgi:hypothetical protein
MCKAHVPADATVESVYGSELTLDSSNSQLTINEWKREYVIQWMNHTSHHFSNSDPKYLFSSMNQRNRCISDTS